MGLSGKNLVAPLLSIHFFLYLNLATLTTGGTNETDRQALLEFKDKIMEDPLGIMSSWNDTIHFCQWHGVKCSQRHQRVTVLNLRSLKLSGTISPYIGNLSFLWACSLQNNSFTHEIPPQMGQLRRLKVLYLDNNSIGGEIPANISGCSNLVSLVIHRNKLVGQIPKELGYLLKLQNLVIGINNLNGSIPSSLGNLSSLQQLWATENNLVGRIPFALGRLMNLTRLDLGDNMLEGEIPPSIFNLSSILWLDLGFNLLQGNLPSGLGNSFPKIEFLSVASNSFSGILPSFSGKTLLSFLDVSNNLFSGQIPGCLLNAESLKYLNLADNNLSGVLPSFSRRTSLESLKANGNKLKGRLPRAFTNCSDLEVLDLGNNMIQDTFPFWLKTSSLKILILRANKLYGEINNLTAKDSFRSLHILDLSSNEFSGHLPKELIQGLKRMLEVSRNGSEYDERFYYEESLTVTIKGIDLVLNRNLKFFNVFDFSNNNFNGEIPEEMGYLRGLHVLNLSQNGFTGRIPPSLGNLSELESFDLSQNTLSGEIPPQLLSLTFLSVMNLSYNNLEGSIPEGRQFGTFSNESYIGNSRLCGFPLTRNCGGFLYGEVTDYARKPQVENEDSWTSSLFDWKIVLMGYASGLVIGFSIGYTILSEKGSKWFPSPNRRRRKHGRRFSQGHRIQRRRN